MLDLSPIASLQYDNYKTESAAKTSFQSNDEKKLFEACQDFESIFLKMMLDSMRKTVNKTELIKTNMAEGIFEDMLYDEYAQKMSKISDIGLADMMFNQLKNTVSNDK